ncbi:MAG TPA: alpha/beta hydrolase [Polyangia bacterium]|nr:alpha/beta hydrolase [Polyangia bacterium]
MPYVPLAPGRIHFAERGERREGQPSILLIHGAGAGSAIWSMTLARIARSAHAVAIDLPGHGPSDRGQGTLDLARHRDAVGLLGAALCLGPSVLVGHSMGALVALDAALAWPDKVRALVLVAAAPRLPVHAELMALVREDPDGARAWLADHGLSPRAKPALRRGFLAAGSAAPPEVVRSDFEIVRATDLTARLSAIRCPLTWLDGADDRIVPPEARGERPGEIVVAPDAGHLLPIEAPAAIAELVAR